jgi:hypothetical protein
MNMKAISVTFACIALISYGNVISATGPDIPDIPDIPDFPDIPDIPDFPDIPDIPDFPDIPDIPPIPDFPDIPPIPDIPDIPPIPDFPDIPPIPDIPDIPMAEGMETTPLEFMFYWYEVYNEANVTKTMDLFTYPLFLVQSGIAITPPEGAPIINYDNLRASEDWAYSVLETVDVLSESDDTAMVDVTFSRFNTADVSYVTIQIYWVLLKVDVDGVPMWKVTSIINTGAPIETGEDLTDTSSD